MDRTDLKGKACPVLADLKIVDAAEYLAAPYGARLLCELGADVVKLEAPAGDGLRAHGPFPDDVRSPDTSAMFHLMNTGKKGLVLDPQADNATAALDLLLADADIVICSAGSAFADLIVARRDELLTKFPRLIIGQTLAVPPKWGTASRSEASLHAAALGGISALIGEIGKAPIVPPYDIVEYLLGANLAGALLAALHTRDATGCGQYVEITASDMANHYVMTPRINDIITGKSSYFRSGRRNTGAMGGIYPWGLYPCRDGFVVLVSHARKNWQGLMNMLGNPEWSNNPRYEDPLVIARTCAEEVDELICTELRRFTRQELFEMSKDFPIAIGPAQTVRDTLESEHLKVRQSLSSIAVGEGEVRYLKRPWLLSGTPVARESKPGPALATAAPLPSSIWDRPAVRQPATLKPWRGMASKAKGQGVLAGMRVVDFAWNWAGPMVGAALADLGAEVIRVEHRGRLDNSRTRARGTVHGKLVEGPIEEVSYYFHQNNRGKMGATLDMKDPVGRELVRRLLDTADLVVENFTPSVFERAGLGFEKLRETNPGLVWLSMTSAGHFGPLSGIRTYAPIMAAMAGLESIIGYEDQEPVGMLGFAFGDASGGAHALMVALAALRHARATGQGQFIDFSLTEAQMSVLAEPMAEIMLTGREPSTQGMQHHRLAPHGNYRCAGNDQWVALSIQDAAGWRKLAELISPDELARDRTLDRAEARRANRKRIDAAIESWTSTRERDALVAELQALQLAATPVLSPDEVARHWPEGNYVVLPHPVTGQDRVLTVPWKMGRTALRPARPAPLVGEHTRYVLETILNIAPDEASALLASPATQ